MGGALLIASVAAASSRVAPSRVAYDQLLYHEPAIRTFAADLPGVNLYDYLSATTPGYHLLLACLTRLAEALLGAPAPGLMLQGASTLIGVALVALLATRVAQYAGVMMGVLLAVPLAFSMHVFAASAYVLPDNAGWLGVLAILLLATSTRVTWKHVVGGAAVLVLLVLCRQSHIWAAALVWVMGLFVAGDFKASIWPGVRRELLPRVPGVAAAVLLTLPAAAVLGYFVHLWGGLVPPRFQGQYREVSLAGPAFLLALVGAFGVFFAPVWMAALAAMVRHPRGRLGFAACVLGAAALSLIPPTTMDVQAGRWTGIWSVANRLPVVLDHASVLMVGLAMLGGVTLAAFMHRVSWRDRLAVLAVVLGYGSVLSVGGELWQRYAEPLVLMLLALLAAKHLAGSMATMGAAAGAGSGEVLAPQVRARRVRLMLGAGLAVLIAAQGGLTAMPFVTGRVYDLRQGPPPARSPDDTGPPTPAELVIPARERR